MKIINAYCFFHGKHYILHIETKEKKLDVTYQVKLDHCDLWYSIYRYLYERCGKVAASINGHKKIHDVFFTKKQCDTIALKVEKNMGIRFFERYGMYFLAKLFRRFSTRKQL